MASPAPAAVPAARKVPVEDLSSDSAIKDAVIGQTLSHYRVESRIGDGGMGVVYRARDLKLGRTVAIKMLAPKYANDERVKARFMREAQAASALDHPNIGTIYDILEQDTVVFIVMAFYEGETLKKHLERGPIPAAEAVAILRQMASALSAAHEAGIVHRDVKPANVMLPRNGPLKLLDFGVAKLTRNVGRILTAQGETVGTILYTSPEQLRGEAVDHRTDLWALGVVGYEMLSGVSPFRASSIPLTTQRILEEEPVPLVSLPGISADLATLVSGLLQKNPVKRPTSAAAVIGLLDHLGTASMPKPAGPVKTTDPTHGEPFGKYRLIGTLTTGGMAELFLALQGGMEGFSKVVALKRILPHMAASPEFVTMFLDEARLAAHLDHPNIVHIYDLGEIDGRYYMAMEYLPGEDLLRVIDLAKKYNRPIAPEIAASIIASAADGLHFAHELTDSIGVPVKLVHRDISPSNIMLTYYGNVKVLDFGIAKATTNLATTRAGVFKGKLAYVAPEQLPGTAGWEIDRRCDVYCLGIVLWELLAGERLFARDSDIATMMAIYKGEIPSLGSLRPEIDAELEEITLKALARNPDGRFKTAAEFRDELDRYLTARAMRPSTKQLAHWLEGLFGEKRANAKKSIAQGVNLHASISEVMRTISKMDIGVQVLGKLPTPQPSSTYEEEASLYAETLPKATKPKSSQKPNLSTLSAPEEAIKEGSAATEQVSGGKRLVFFVTFLGFAILTLLLGFWLTSW